MSQFNEDYFERGEEKNLSCYSRYRWLPDLTIPMAYEIVTALGIRKFETIVDYGCAKGFLVRALRLLRYQAWGVDISEYAISKAPDDVKSFLSTGARVLLDAPSKFDWTISKDVLEHISHEQLASVLYDIAGNSERAFIIVPLGDGAKYNAPEYERDVTHIIREDLRWWSTKFNSTGFIVEHATTDMPFIKKQRCKDSDGFFTLRSRR